MAGRRLATSLASSRRVGSTRGATRVDYHSLVLVVGLLALAAFAGVLYLSQASVAAGLRYRLGEAEREQRELWVDNLALRQAICTAERLTTVEERSARLGLVDAPVMGPYLACTVPESAPATVRRTPGSARAVDEAASAGSTWRDFFSGFRQQDVAGSEVSR